VFSVLSSLIVMSNSSESNFSTSSFSSHPKPIAIKPATAHTATVIFLHGLGDSGAGWYDGMKIVQELENQHIKFILPSASTQRVTLNGGMMMPSWYDIKSLDRNSKDREDVKGVDEAKLYVQHLVENEEKSGIPTDRIIVGGFSQGASIALDFSYHYTKKLAGALCLSGYIPVNQRFASLVNKANINTPALVCHGTDDELIPIVVADMAVKLLKDVGISVEMNKYPGLPHSASDEELMDVAQWIHKQLPPNPSKI